MTNPNYLELILEYISSNNGLEIASIDPDKNFVEEGYLDSMDIYGLLLALEKESGRKLDLTELARCFPSTITKLVHRLEI